MAVTFDTLFPGGAIQSHSTSDNGASWGWNAAFPPIPDDPGVAYGTSRYFTAFATGIANGVNYLVGAMYRSADGTARHPIIYYYNLDSGTNWEVSTFKSAAWSSTNPRANATTNPYWIPNGILYDNSDANPNNWGFVILFEDMDVRSLAPSTTIKVSRFNLLKSNGANHAPTDWDWVADYSHETGISTGVGAGFLTQVGKAWVTNTWAGADLIDSAAARFPILSNNGNTLTVVGTPAAGAYTIKSHRLLVVGMPANTGFTTKTELEFCRRFKSSMATQDGYGAKSDLLLQSDYRLATDATGDAWSYVFTLKRFLENETGSTNYWALALAYAFSKLNIDEVTYSYVQRAALFTTTTNPITSTSNFNWLIDVTSSGKNVDQPAFDISWNHISNDDDRRLYVMSCKGMIAYGQTLSDASMWRKNVLDNVAGYNLDTSGSLRCSAFQRSPSSNSCVMLGGGRASTVVLDINKHARPFITKMAFTLQEVSLGVFRWSSTVTYTGVYIYPEDAGKGGEQFGAISYACYKPSWENTGNPAVLFSGWAWNDYADHTYLRSALIRGYDNSDTPLSLAGLPADATSTDANATLFYASGGSDFLWSPDTTPGKPVITSPCGASPCVTCCSTGGVATSVTLSVATNPSASYDWRWRKSGAAWPMAPNVVAGTGSIVTTVASTVGAGIEAGKVEYQVAPTGTSIWSDTFIVDFLPTPTNVIADATRSTCTLAAFDLGNASDFLMAQLNYTANGGSFANSKTYYDIYRDGVFTETQNSVDYTTAKHIAVTGTLGTHVYVVKARNCIGGSNWCPISYAPPTAAQHTGLTCTTQTVSFYDTPTVPVYTVTPSQFFDGTAETFVFNVTTSYPVSPTVTIQWYLNGAPDGVPTPVATPYTLALPALNTTVKCKATNTTCTSGFSAEFKVQAQPTIAP